jgi:hypothetical protein
MLGGGQVDWSNWTEKYMDRWAEIRERYTRVSS